MRSTIEQRLLKLEQRVGDDRQPLSVVYSIMQPGQNGPEHVYSLKRGDDGRLMELAA